VPPVTGDEDEGDSSAALAADDKPATSPLKAPSDDMLAALSKAQPPPAQGPAQEEETSEIAAGASVEGEDAPDPEEEASQRRAAIAARMARLGGTRVGMGPHIFGRKLETKPKPAELAPETSKEEPSTADIRVAIYIRIMSSGCLLNAHLIVPLPTSPLTNETAVPLQPQVTPSGTVYIAPPMPLLVSDLIRRELPSTAPCFRNSSYSSAVDARPAGTAPRRFFPRKKSSQTQMPPAETEAATPSFEKNASIHNVPDSIPGRQTTPVSVPDYVEPEIRCCHRSRC
jgi:myosin tail region-interacting protein MTI1